MAITETVTSLPSPPHRGVDDRSTFVSKAEALFDALKNLTVDEINTIATQINSTSTDINTKHDTVVAKEALVNPHYTAIESVYSNISDVNTTSANISNINTTAVSIDNINTTATNIASVNTVATDIANLYAISSNIAEILLADDNAATATTQAGIATTQAVIATEQAVIATSVVASIPDGSINDSITTLTDAWSSTKISEDLALKANAANPTFTGLITEQVSVSTLTLGATSSVQTYTATADFTIVDDLVSGESITLILTNGGFTPTYPTITWWDNADGTTEPTLQTTDKIKFEKVGATLYGSHIGSIL